MYVNDLLIHSSTFTEYLHHIDLVLDRPTSAGFTVNATKCQFCKPESSFSAILFGMKVSKQTLKVLKHF
jgi:hypothetical protein